MLNRTRTVLALGIAVVFVAVGSLVGAPTASACGIGDDGRCLVTPIVIRTDSLVKHKHVQKHKKRHLPAKPAAVEPLPWQGPGGQGGPEGTQQPTSYDPTQNAYDPYQYGDIFGQVQQSTLGGR